MMGASCPVIGSVQVAVCDVELFFQHDYQQVATGGLLVLGRHLSLAEN